jgi:DNA-binding NtrC family response regulator
VKRILIVDDVEAMREQYAYDIARLGGYETLTAAAGDEALQRLRSEPVHCVVLDLEMPRVDGFELLRTLQHEGSEVPVIVYTGTGDVERAVRAMRLGARGFVEKRDPIERLLMEIERALERERLGGELRRSRALAGEDAPLIGDSAPMRALKEAIARVAPIPSTVLVTGESGSGKDLVARELHRLSGRKGTYLAVNCAALPGQTLEDELFGHVKGAFTGADRPRKGAFEEASGGTLFLDEIGELPPPAQAALLRVLEEKRILRLGSSQPVAVDARVVAATHRDLPADVEAGRFRRDLLYRLKVHGLEVPPLRARLEDLPAIAEQLLARICRDFGRPRAALAPVALAALKRHDWRQNNVRELRNVLEQMLIVADGDTLEPRHLPSELRGTPEGAEREDTGSFRDRRRAAERRIVREALGRNGGQLTRTARELGLADHSSLSKLMRRLGLERDTD